VPEDTTNTEWRNVLKERVLQSDRMQVAQKMLIESIRNKIKNDASPTDLASDSLAMAYYRNNLEKYNTEFAEQLDEFKQGNLLFGIMQRKVWDAAVEDSAALVKFYNSNRDKYFWENSADAMIISVLAPDSVEQAMYNVKNKPDEWRHWSEQSNGTILADSGRFELSQIPVIDRTNFTEGLITAPVINEQDSSRTFAYIIKIYNGREPKKFEDARGSVINDYQTYLEDKWIAELKKKYPVKINRKVFRSLPANN
jgi:peptidyl-prolyl cis-trans isomerase SurA